MRWLVVITVIAPITFPALAGDGTTIRIIETPQVSQPLPFSKGGKTVIVPRTRIEIDEGTRRLAQQIITGKPRIIDGDTIVIDSQPIRLHGIDAPEAKQTCERPDRAQYRCGDMATFALAELAGKHWVRCEWNQRDRYRRLIAICYTGPVNLNAEMVRRGWAMAYRRYSKDYVGEEQEARNAARGLWQGAFLPPWEWRRKK